MPTRLVQSGGWAPTTPPYPVGAPARPGPRRVRAARCDGARGAGLGAVVLVRRVLRRVEVVGGSMAPTFARRRPSGGAVPPVRPPGRPAVGASSPWATRGIRPHPGQAGGRGRRRTGALDLRGDDPGASTDSRTSGPCPPPRWSAGSSTATPRRGAPALAPGPGGTIDGDAEHPGRPQPPPRPELPRRCRRPVARRHPPDADRVPGGGGLTLLPAAADPGPAGHRPRLPRAPGGLDRTGPVQRRRQPGRHPRRPRAALGSGRNPILFSPDTEDMDGTHHRARRDPRRRRDRPPGRARRRRARATSPDGSRPWSAGCPASAAACTSGSTPSRPSWSSGTSPAGPRWRASCHEGAGRPRRRPVRQGAARAVQRARVLHPRAAQLGPPVAPAPVGAGRDLQPVPEPDRAWAATPVRRDPPADRQGPAHLGRDALRPGRDPRAPRPATPTCPGTSSPTST